MKLDQELRKKLMKRKGEWPALSVKAKVSYSWVCKFAAGTAKNPSYDFLTRLDKALKEK